MFFVDLTSINIEFCTQNYQIKGAVRFNLAVVTKKYKIFIKRYCPRIWAPGIKCNLELFPKDFMYTHLQKMWLIESLSCLQKEQLMSFSIPMCIKTILVANILCTSLIWNDFSFISWMFCIFLKVLLCSQSCFPFFTALRFFTLCKQLII